ncbi:MAG: sensor histidine kinase [Paenibacillaceae bacterium]
MAKLQQRVWTKIKSMRIVPKLIIGYLLLIVAPFTLFGYIYYKEMNQNFLSQYLIGEERIMEQAYSNLKVNLSRAESVHQLFQNNVKLIEYLNGAYITDWEMIYNYVKEINPTFSFAYLSNPIVDEIRIFKENESALSLEPDIVNRDTLDKRVWMDSIKPLLPNQGLWAYTSDTWSELPSFQYYHKIFTSTFSKELGVIKISTNGELLRQFFRTLESSDGELNIMLIDPAQRDKVVYSQFSNSISKEQIVLFAEAAIGAEDKTFYNDQKRWMINAVYIERLGLTAVEISDVQSMFESLHSRNWWMIVIGAILLVLLSGLYYVTASSVTKRILRLSRHMKRVNSTNFSTYEGRTGPDEIGFLISSYNGMIMQIDELVNSVHRSELMKKEADFKMLQAQIKPHFLYNTLEAMRMQAEMNEDAEVAEMASSLGSLLRYSLSKSEDETTLRYEIEHIEHYMAIHKVRMGERLQVEWIKNGDVTNVECPRFILQPLVENCIQHGLSGLRKQGFIRIHIDRLPEGAVVTIEDNGLGIATERLAIIDKVLDGSLTGDAIPFKGGIGLHSVSERIKSYYGKAAGISITSQEGHGTICTLYLLNGEE